LRRVFACEHASLRAYSVASLAEREGARLQRLCLVLAMTVLTSGAEVCANDARFRTYVGIARGACLM
jgi:hypothetical protein